MGGLESKEVTNMRLHVMGRECNYMLRVPPDAKHLPLTSIFDPFITYFSLPSLLPIRFHIMGGECNYMLRVTPDTKRLEFVPEAEWETPTMKRWDEGEIATMLAEARSILEESAKRLNLQVGHGSGVW